MPLLVTAVGGFARHEQKMPPDVMPDVSDAHHV
jgi:hypothetical protein